MNEEEEESFENKKTEELEREQEQEIDSVLNIGYRSCGNSRCGTCAGRGGKLHVYDWLDDLPTPPQASDLVEVQFKNTRKGYYRNSNGLSLHKGDIVAVESSPGHDIGEVTLTGRLVSLQMHKSRINPATFEFKRVYRVAKPTDIEKWEEAKALEHETMLESRRIAEMLNLNMKIGDVEYQGDKTKAIFYYIADERVDFRELIKVLADRFRVRIEMKQIGARQEAGRIGGIGPCGRELCCASWMSNFVSVTTSSARIQDISLNPQKLAGQCGKLKCCLNYELDAYLDAMRSFPPTDVPLESAEGTYYYFKSDIFKGIMWYTPQKDTPSNIVGLEVAKVKEVMEMNACGRKPDKLQGLETMAAVTDDTGYSNVVELDDLTRFDDQNKKRGRGKKGRRGGQQPHGQRQGGTSEGGQRRQPRQAAAPDRADRQPAAPADADSEQQPQHERTADSRRQPRQGGGRRRQGQGGGRMQGGSRPDGQGGGTPAGTPESKD